MKKSNSKLFKRQSYMGYIYILPFIIGFVVLFLGPLISLLKFSLSKITLESGYIETEYVGLKNFLNIIKIDPVFNKYFYITMRKLLFLIPSVAIYSIFAANILNKKFVGRTIVRAIFFLPVLSTMVFYTPQQIMGSASVNHLVSSFVSHISLTKYLNSLNLPANTISKIIAMAENVNSVINIAGLQIFLFLAALQAIPGHLYEASSIEGASKWDDLWKITVPMISPYIIICVIYTIVNSYYSEGNVRMILFDSSGNQIAEGYRGGGNLIAEYIRNVTRQGSDYASAAAAACVYMIAMIILILLIGAVLKKATTKFD